MTEGIKAWIQLAADEPLPQMRKTSETLRRLARFNDPDLSRIIEVIRQDCGYAIQLLRRLSELKSKRQVSEVSTLERAVVMLGSGRALSLADELPVLEDLLDGVRLAGYMRVAARSYHAARQAFDWAGIRGDRVPQAVELAAFLHSLGELVLWRFGKQEMVKLEQAPRSDSLDEAGPGKLEIQVLGFGIQELGRELAKRWQLPSLVHTCLIPTSALEPRTLGPIFAAKLAYAVQHGWYHPATLELVDMAGDYLDMSTAEGAVRVHITAVDTSRTADFHGVTPVAAGLIYSGQIPQIVQQPQRAARTGETATKKKKPQTDTQKTPVVASALKSDMAVYHKTLEQLNKENLAVNAILNAAMNGLHIGLGLKRVLFTVMTPERDALSIRYTAGVADDPSFKGFQLPLMPPHLLTRLMEEPQSLWVHDGNTDKFWHHVPQRLRELIKVKTFFTMSIFANARPVGMFYADMASSENDLDQAGFIGFKSICTLTGQALGRSRSNSKTLKKSA
jgi:HD-like signal output (HDOD) protein